MEDQNTIEIVPSRKVVYFQYIVGAVLFIVCMLALAFLKMPDDSTTVSITSAGVISGIVFTLIAIAVSEIRYWLSDSGVRIEKRRGSTDYIWPDFVRGGHSTCLGSKWTLVTRQGEKIILRDDGFDPDTWSFIPDVFAIVVNQNGGDVRVDMIHKLFVDKDTW